MRKNVVTLTPERMKLKSEVYAEKCEVKHKEIKLHTESCLWNNNHQEKFLKEKILWNYNTESPENIKLNAQES